MARSGTVAVLLPGAYYFLRDTKAPPVAALRAAGVPMAIASDHNPGSSPGLSLLLMLIWFEEQAVFTQRVKLTATEATVKGLVNFMTCNDQMCDPPSDQEFEFVLAGIPAADTVAAGSVA